MVLLPSSILILLINTIMQHMLPIKQNKLLGFRTRKSMRNNENWDKAQHLSILYTKRYFYVSCIMSVPLLIIDIVLIVTHIDTFILISVIVQSTYLIAILFFIIYKVDRQLP